jgi:hypothetical protein
MAINELKQHCLIFKFFNKEPELVKQVFRGLTALSSVYASVRAGEGISNRY